MNNRNRKLISWIGIITLATIVLAALISAAGNDFAWYARCPECGAVSKQPISQEFIPCLHCGHSVEWISKGHPDYAAMRSEYNQRLHGSGLCHSWFLFY